MAEDRAWELRVGYDYRFGVVALAVTAGQEHAKFEFRLPDLLRSLGVKPHELRAYLDEAAGPRNEATDIEPARRRAIEETDLAGRTVCDLAGYDGSMAKIALERGAKRVVVVDSEQWNLYGWAQPKPIPGVEFVKANLYDWYEPFDVVIWYNCLYHVADPMRALAHVRSITKETMLLCTLFRYHDGPWMYCYLPRECNPTDPSVYFGPSINALERMLALTGWTYEQKGLALDRVVYECKPIPDFVDAETQEVRRVANVDPR